MKSSSLITRSLFALIVSTGLCASVYAQAPAVQHKSVPAASVNTTSERTAVAAVDVEAHLKSHVVTSVTVGAPIEAAAPAMVVEPQTVVLKTVVAAR